MLQHKYLLLSLFVLCCLSCVSKRDNLDVMEIDVSNPQTAYLDDLVGEQRIIPIQENPTFEVGNVFCSKSYGGMIFLYNEALRQINCVDEDGKPVCSLNALGRGDGEYIDIGTFTYNDEAKTLDIYERATRTLKSYAVPSMEQVRSLHSEYYFNVIEWVKGNLYLGVRESVKPYSSDYSALILYDVDSGVVIDSIGIREDQADYTMDNAFSLVRADNIYAVVPGQSNTVYSVNEEGINPVFNFCLVPDDLRDTYWKKDYSEDNDENVYWSKFQTGNIAELPSFYVESESVRSFYYFTNAEWPSHGLPMLNLCLLHGTEAEVYDTLRIKGIDNPISPIGVHNGKYVALLETENLEYSGEMGEIAKEIQQAQENGAEHVIVLYSFK